LAKAFPGGGNTSGDAAPGTEITFTDRANVLRTYIEQSTVDSKSFLVISDPVQANHVLRDANTLYDKGILLGVLKRLEGEMKENINNALAIYFKI